MGYASYDIDRYDDYSDNNLQYRRYKECILDLEKEYLRPVYGKRLVNALNKRISTY